MMSNRNSSPKPRSAVEKYDRDDLRHLLPYAQEGKLGCVVSLERNPDSFVDEISSNRKLMGLDACCKSTESDDDDQSSIGDATTCTNDSGLDDSVMETSVEHRQRRHSFRRAAQRIFSLIIRSISKFFNSFRTPPEDVDIYDFRAQRMPKKYRVTVRDRAEDMFKHAAKVNRDVLGCIFGRRANSKKRQGPGKSKVAMSPPRVPPHQPELRVNATKKEQ